MVMMLACGLLDTDLIASNSSAGVPIVSWWVIIGLVYMLPSALIMCELTLAFPKDGGLYHWVAEGIGLKWATRVSWMYWACGVFLPPASYLMASDLAFSTFLPDAGPGVRIAVAIALIWIGTFVCSLPMGDSKHVFNVIGVTNIAVYLFVFLAGVFYVATGHAPANDISPASFVPRFDEAAIYVPIAFFCASGIELAAQSVENTADPKRDILRSALIITVMLVGLSSLGSIGVLLVQPMDELSIISGTADIFVTGWGSRVLYTIINVQVFVGIFAQVSSWLIAGARGIAEAAKEGEFPAVFAKETKAGLPWAAMAINASIATLFLLAYALFANGAEDAFYDLMGCSTIASMAPYVLMVIAYNRLRRGKLKDYRGWKAPFGIPLSWVLQVSQILAIMLLLYVPGQGMTESAPSIILGSAVVMLLGEAIIAWQDRKRKAGSSGE